MIALHEDKDFWINLKWPAAPNQDDYNVFEQHCKGRVLMLGSTKLLLPLCTEAWDLAPKYDNEKIKTKDWFELNEHFDTIIMDGGIAFGKEFTERLLSVILPNCDRFVVRSFLKTTWESRYAVYFPRAHELNPQPEEIPINEVYTFFIWNK